MSHAFVKGDWAGIAPSSDLPIVLRSNCAAPRGLVLVRAALLWAQARLAQLRGSADKLNPAAERDMCFFVARLKSALLLSPKVRLCAEAALDHAVGSVDAARAESSVISVSKDEADTVVDLIALHLPFARALIGARSGDVVISRCPPRTMAPEVSGIAWP